VQRQLMRIFLAQAVLYGLSAALKLGSLPFRRFLAGGFVCISSWSGEAAVAAPGNVNAAIKALSSNIESLTCDLDNQGSVSGTSCQQLDNVVRWRAGKLFTIRQDWGGSASTGAAIWNGANVAVNYLENQLGPSALTGKSVIELGAGVGFTSLVAEALGAREVVITDGNDDVLRLAAENISINAEHRGGTSIRTARLRWNTAEDEAPLLKAKDGQPWDYIIASDVTYRKAAWPDLLACIGHLLEKGGKAIVSMEPRNMGEVEGVLAEATKQGLVSTEVSIPTRPGTLCEPFCARLFVLSRE